MKQEEKCDYHGEKIQEIIKELEESHEEFRGHINYMSKRLDKIEECLLMITEKINKP